jgi:hypothetical protein
MLAQKLASQKIDLRISRPFSWTCPDTESVRIAGTMWNGGEQDDKGIELYDRRLDPSEISNLALSKDHSEVIESLRRKWGAIDP